MYVIFWYDGDRVKSSNMKKNHSKASEEHKGGVCEVEELHLTTAPPLNQWCCHKSGVVLLEIGLRHHDAKLCVIPLPLNK